MHNIFSQIFSLRKIFERAAVKYSQGYNLHSSFKINPSEPIIYVIISTALWLQRSYKFLTGIIYVTRGEIGLSLGGMKSKNR